MRRFFKLVEITTPPTREELEAAGESVIEFEINDGIDRKDVDEAEGGAEICAGRLQIYHRSGWFTPDSPACKDHGAKVEIYGDADFLSELLITHLADKLRFRAPFPWHFGDVKNDLRRFGFPLSKYYLSDCDKKAIARWFPALGAALLEKDKAILEKDAAIDALADEIASHYEKKSADGVRA